MKCPYCNRRVFKDEETGRKCCWSCNWNCSPRKKTNDTKSCCDEAIDKGALVYKGRANIVCPTCGKDQMLKLIWFHDCGFEYIDGKGLKKIKRTNK